MRRDVRSIVAMEFALVAIPFFMFILFIFELSYDLYTQEALDAGLHAAVRQIQTGNAQNVVDENGFIASYFCPDLRGLLECTNHLFVKVQRVTLTGAADYYSVTDGKLPVTNGVLDMTAYTNGTGSFCNAGAAQFLLVTAIYLGPSFIGSILPNVLSATYKGSTVHATMSTAGLVTEYFPAQLPGAGVTPAPAC